MGRGEAGGPPPPRNVEKICQKTKKTLRNACNALWKHARASKKPHTETTFGRRMSQSVVECTSRSWNAFISPSPPHPPPWFPIRSRFSMMYAYVLDTFCHILRFTWTSPWTTDNVPCTTDHGSWTMEYGTWTMDVINIRCTSPHTVQCTNSYLSVHQK